MSPTGANSRVLKLPAGATARAVWPFTERGDPAGVAVDALGNVYVTEFHNQRVLELAVR